MLACNIMKSHVNIDILHVDIIMLHVIITVMHVDINKSHVIIITLHVDIIYLAWKRQKYATIQQLCILSFRRVILFKKKIDINVT